MLHPRSFFVMNLMLLAMVVVRRWKLVDIVLVWRLVVVTRFFVTRAHLKMASQTACAALLLLAPHSRILAGIRIKSLALAMCNFSFLTGGRGRGLCR